MVHPSTRTTKYAALMLPVNAAFIVVWLSYFLGIFAMLKSKSKCRALALLTKIKVSFSNRFKL